MLILRLMVVATRLVEWNGRLDIARQHFGEKMRKSSRKPKSYGMLNENRKWMMHQELFFTGDRKENIDF